MNCDEVSELLPAYVLGALDAEEMAAVEAHLREGREHDEELVDLRATVFALDRFADDLAGDTSEDAMAPAVSPQGLAGRTRRSPLWITTIAAAVALALFGAGWLFGALTDGSGQEVSIEVQGASGRHVVLAGSSGADSVTVTMAGFDRLPEGEAYQLWAIRDGVWQRIGTCNTSPDGWWKGDFAFTVQPGEQVAITIEPKGGSSNPTSAPIFISGS